jgi:transposase-like protein
MAEPASGKELRHRVPGALRVKSKQDGKSCNKSVALGVHFEGQKEVLGLLDSRK